MLNEHYSMTLALNTPRKINTLRTVGTILTVLSLALFVSAFYASYFIFIAFAIVLTAGIACIVTFNRSAKSYRYDVDEQMFVVAKTDMVGKTTRVLQVNFQDVTLYGAFLDVLTDGDLVFLDNHQCESAKQLVFVENGQSKRALIAPDTYMDALLSERISLVLSNKFSSVKGKEDKR